MSVSNKIIFLKFLLRNIWKINLRTFRNFRNKNEACNNGVTEPLGKKLMCRQKYVKITLKAFKGEGHEIIDEQVKSSVTVFLKTISMNFYSFYSFIIHQIAYVNSFKESAALENLQIPVNFLQK